MKIGPRSLRPRARGESATFFLFHLHSLLLTVDFVCVCVLPESLVQLCTQPQTAQCLTLDY
jgi:hypothetical protein